MSATNSTANYELPIFLATDKPAWLTDWNGAMNAIDTAIHSAQSTADGAQTTAGTCVADIATINASLTTITGNITNLTTTVNGNTGAINTINSLIGNGQPTTEDKTIIGAINEIYAMIGGGSTVTADVVTYSNTASGLTATNVQSAIDEVVSKIPAPGPTPTEYDFDITAHSGAVTITPESTATLNQFVSEVNYLLNDDKSIGKIYGGIYLENVPITTANSWNTVATLTATDFPALANAYNVNIGFAFRSTSTGLTPRPCRLAFNTNGSVNVQVKAVGTGTDEALAISMVPFVMFLKEMGD